MCLPGGNVSGPLAPSAGEVLYPVFLFQRGVGGCKREVLPHTLFDFSLFSPASLFFFSFFDLAPSLCFIFSSFVLLSPLFPPFFFFRLPTGSQFSSAYPPSPRAVQCGAVQFRYGVFCFFFFSRSLFRLNHVKTAFRSVPFHRRSFARILVGLVVLALFIFFISFAF